jgi:hypothetical protein
MSSDSSPHTIVFGGTSIVGAAGAWSNLIFVQRYRGANELSKPAVVSSFRFPICARSAPPIIRSK